MRKQVLFSRLFFIMNFSAAHGQLVPRMATTQRNAIVSPADN
jgi:hypothetical protein